MNIPLCRHNRKNVDVGRRRRISSCLLLPTHVLLEPDTLPAFITLIPLSLSFARYIALVVVLSSLLSVHSLPTFNWTFTYHRSVDLVVNVKMYSVP
ncbi:hypothetical protein FIBSPDRAFT_534285 [Athelia psychrophila]|uniref:Uncharacterized protein n=1 Tax=Athelia psychrophila TaxID=1759441 RepID=A0A166JCL5_9AGAM|nr:hypothetical protein FIBSPDRAFT_534285 [Fibularhizoctonia sp. CBS 109695]